MDAPLNELVDFDLESYALQIKANSTLIESGGTEAAVSFYSADEMLIGAIRIARFANRTTYLMSACVPSFKSIPVTLPNDTDRIWTFTKTSASFKIECNDVVVVENMYTESEYQDNCESTWAMADVEMIKFWREYGVDEYSMLGKHD